MKENHGNENICRMLGIAAWFPTGPMLSTKTGESWKREEWLPKNAVFQLFLSKFLNVSGAPAWIRTSGHEDSEMDSIPATQPPQYRASLNGLLGHGVYAQIHLAAITIGS
jgi:hypothetical protein